MLGARIASAAVLIPIVLGLLWLGPETTALGTALAAVIGTYEFYTIAARSPYRFQPFAVGGYAASALFSLAGYLRQPLLMLAIIAGLGVAAFLYLRLAPGYSSFTSNAAGVATTSPPGKLGANWAISLFGPIYVGVPLGLVALIRSERPNLEAVWWILLICLGTWGADTGGYFAGRFFGKHKLAPKISPKKTVEGAIGGILLAMLGVALVGGLALNIPIYLTLPLGLVLAVASIAGDLFESWIKRRFDTKDSGKLIPGHGGLLDRIDSLLAVTVLVYLFMLIYPR